MTITVRDVHADELDTVLALNNSAGPSILALDQAGLRRLWEQADYFRVAEVEGRIAGFLVAMLHTSDYTSPNFRWFREHYPAFLYVDRIVVATTRRGAGVGRVFYADVQSFAEVRVPMLTSEVFLEETSGGAMLFHGTFGYGEVGQQVMEGPGRRVSLLAKPLCSYEWVRETYGETLPDVPWLAPSAAHRRPLQTLEA
ncbi:GNAT family N-acetyltransferase [Coralloluteibacterium stylophorae]|uniref:GNAT family N-acetyltransferase n=1 Tax=Coralloluteibacterium stylophorae TaxID=1776034 RepID=A0A8J7VSJ5_9GAMM|nr:GNAT family N-acetyltransferase [Coralloluteibacterium stylophorae]MBS7456417.1 GNAT family N-acetyltransferase [Coralloluteibacterium stylophorae]